MEGFNLLGMSFDQILALIAQVIAIYLGAKRGAEVGAENGVKNGNGHNGPRKGFLG